MWRRPTTPGELDAGTAVTHNTLRMFRNRPQYRYRGRLHEQIAETLPTYLPERIEYTNVRIEHYGYLGAVRDAREKYRRNVELLQMQLEEGKATPFLHYNLGAEYAVAGDPQAALVELERAWELLSPTLSATPTNSLRRWPTDWCGRRAPAGASRMPWSAPSRRLSACPASPTWCWSRVWHMCSWARSSKGWACMALHRDGRRAQPLHRHRRLRQLPADGGARRTALRTRRAGGGQRHPGALRKRAARLHRSAAAICKCAACLRLQSQSRWLRRSSAGCLSPMRQRASCSGTALYEGGATQAGEQQFRLVLERQPHSGRARVALAESLLAQRRYSEAAAVACEIHTEDPLAIMACRSELFARLAGGDLVGAGAALARTQGTEMIPAESDLFTAWFELAGGRGSEIELSTETLGLLGTILEALLRVHDFDVFEVALGLVAQTVLSSRERREMLGEIYLRRGFAASAAEEWLAVCGEQPEDVRALFGLARVAERQGMAAEALDFAQAALAVEPEHAAAAALLERVREAGVSGEQARTGAIDEGVERRAAA